MNAACSTARTLFLEAVENLSPDEWPRFLDAACGGDDALRQEVSRLLTAHQQASHFMEHPAAGPAATIALPAGEFVGCTIGRYKLLEQIGEGGMGVVYVAEQTEPVRRRVALKIIKPGMDTRQVIARFEAERQALAMMDHPNIARILDAGTTEEGSRHTPCAVADDGTRSVPTTMGRPYFVMELVRGLPITDYCDQARLDPRQRLELFVTVCQAIQHAHQKGIIHRDIKPTNILVALYDDVPVPKVIDFGVAKATAQKLTEKTMFTGFGQLIGTLEYMSPEQAQFNQLDIDTRSDIYSLGVLLYELLTGSTPFEQSRLRTVAFDETLRIIREEEPLKPSTKLNTADTLPVIAASRNVAPTQLRRQVKGDLDSIVMKCMEKDRNRRYETANGLATDLERYLADEPVRACPPSAWYRLRKLARRNKMALTMAALVSLALVGGAVVSTWQAIRATWAEAGATELAQQSAADRDRALAQQRRAEDAERAVKDQLWRAKVAEAAAMRSSGQPGRRLDSLDRLDAALRIVRDLGVEEENKLQFRNQTIACLALSDLRSSTQCEAPLTKSHHVVAFDAPLERYAYGTDARGTISVRRVADNREMLQLAGPGQPAPLMRFSPDGRFLAALHDSSAHRYLGRIWDLERNEMILQASALVPYCAMEFSPDSRRLAAGEPDGSICLYDLPEGTEHKRLSKGVVPYHLAFQPDGRKLAVSGYDTRIVQVRDLESGQILQTLRHASAVRGIAWRGDGKRIAAASGPRIALWEAETGRLLGQWEGHESEVIGVAFSHRGNLLASTSWDPFLRLWDVATGRQLLSSSGGQGNVYGLRFSPDDRRLAYSLAIPKLSLWEVAPGHECRILVGRMGLGRGSWSGDFSPDSRLLAVAGRDAVHLWDLAAGEEAATLPEECTAVLFTPDGKSLLTTSSRGLKIWPVLCEPSAENGPPRTLRIGPAKTLRSDFSLGRACLSADGQVLVAGAQTPRTSALVVPVDDPDRSVVLTDNQDFNSVALTADGCWMASGSFYGLGVKIWDTRSGAIVRELSDLGPAYIAFSPDGETLVTCHREAYAFWDVRSWQRRQLIAREEVSGVPGVVDFAPHGKMLAIAHGPSLVQLRDPATGRELATLQASGRHEVHWLRFSSDGSLLAIGCANDQVQLWDLRPIRKQLAERGLDWDLPPYPPADPSHASIPVSIEVLTGDTTDN